MAHVEGKKSVAAVSAEVSGEFCGSWVEPSWRTALSGRVPQIRVDKLGVRLDLNTAFLLLALLLFVSVFPVDLRSLLLLVLPLVALALFALFVDRLDGAEEHLACVSVHRQTAAISSSHSLDICKRRCHFRKKGQHFWTFVF